MGHDVGLGTLKLRPQYSILLAFLSCQLQLRLVRTCDTEAQEKRRGSRQQWWVYRGLYAPSEASNCREAQLQPCCIQLEPQSRQLVGESFPGWPGLTPDPQYLFTSWFDHHHLFNNGSLPSFCLTPLTRTRGGIISFLWLTMPSIKRSLIFLFFAIPFLASIKSGFIMILTFLRFIHACFIMLHLKPFRLIKPQQPEDDDAKDDDAFDAVDARRWRRR